MKGEHWSCPRCQQRMITHVTVKEPPTCSNKHKQIETNSSIIAITQLLTIPNKRDVIKTNFISYIIGELSKLFHGNKENDKNIGIMNEKIEIAKAMDETCFAILNDDFGKVGEILNKSIEANRIIITEYQTKITGNTNELSQIYERLNVLEQKDELTKEAEKEKKNLESEISKLEKNTRSNQTKMQDIQDKNKTIEKILTKLQNNQKLTSDDKTTIKMLARKEMKDNNLLKKQAMLINLNAVQKNLTNEIYRLECVLKKIQQQSDDFADAINTAITDANNVDANNVDAINTAIAHAAVPADDPIMNVAPQITKKVIQMLRPHDIIEAFDIIRTLCDIIQLKGNLNGLGSMQPFKTVDTLIEYFTEEDEVTMDGNEEVIVMEQDNVPDARLDVILGNSYQETKKVSFVLDFHDKVLQILPNKTITDIEKLSSNFKDEYYRKMSKAILSEGYADAYQVTQDSTLMFELNHQLFLNKCDLLKAEYNWAEKNLGELKDGSIIKPLKDFNAMLVNAGLQCVSLLEDLQRTIDYNKDITTKKAEGEADINILLNNIVTRKDKFLTDFRDSNPIKEQEIQEIKFLLQNINVLVGNNNLGRNKPFKVPLLNVYSQLKSKYELNIEINTQSLKEVWFLQTLSFFIEAAKAPSLSFNVLDGLHYFLSNFSVAKKADTESVQTKITNLFNALNMITVGADINALNDEVYKTFTDLVNMDDFDLQNLFSTEDDIGVRKNKLLKQILDFKNDADNKKELQKQKEAAEAAKALEKQQKQQNEVKKKGILNKLKNDIKTFATTVVKNISEVIKPNKVKQDYNLLTKAQQSSLKELSGPILKALVPFQKRSPNAIASYFATSSEKMASNLTKYREIFIQKMDNCLKDMMLSVPISSVSNNHYGGKTVKINKKYTRKQKNDKPKKKKYTHSRKLRIKNHLTKKYKNDKKAKKKQNSKRK